MNKKTIILNIINQEVAKHPKEKQQEMRKLLKTASTISDNEWASIKKVRFVVSHEFKNLHDMTN